MTEPAYWDKGSKETAEALRKGPPRRGTVFWIGVTLTSCIAVPALVVGLLVGICVFVCCLPLIGWLRWLDQLDGLFWHYEGEP